jgi:putative phosphoribosyl transferase
MFVALAPVAPHDARKGRGPVMVFKNRETAGHALSQRLLTFAGADTVVIGLPRGGVAVAAPVAAALNAPLDVRVVKKIGAPGQPELALGAVTASGTTAWNHSLVEWLHLSRADQESLRSRAQVAAQSREKLIRSVYITRPLRGKVAVVVDDGIATGMTVEAVLRAVHAEGPRQTILAAPVMAPGAAQRLADSVDKVVALEIPRDFFAVGAFYQEFSPVEDEEVLQLLRRSQKSSIGQGRYPTPPPRRSPPPAAAP